MKILMGGAKQRSGYVAFVVLLLWSVGGSIAAQQSDASVPDRLKAIEDSQAKIAKQLEEVTRQLAQLAALVQAQRAPALPTTAPPPLPSEPLPLTGLPLKGSPSAGVVLLEISDFQCPFCGAFTRDTLPTIDAQYVATGKVALVFQHLPGTPNHPFALRAAEGAECAFRQGKFWQMHDALFAQQSRLSETLLMDSAKAIGLNVPDFDLCLKGAGTVPVRQQASAARQLGINGTPTFFIGKRLQNGTLKVSQRLEGAKPFSEFKKAIDAAMVAK